MSQDGGAWQAVSSNSWRPKLFFLLALDEIDSDEEMPRVSHENFPSVSLETESGMEIVPKGEKIKTKDTEAEEVSANTIPNHSQERDHWWSGASPTQPGGRQ